MSKVRKLVSVFLAALMIVSLMSLAPITSNAAQSGDFEYVVSDDGTIEIVKYSGSTREVNVPDSIGGIKVTSIGESAFSNCTSIVNVYLPESIIKIKYNSFANCTNLESINIPNNVNSIGYCAFSNCEKLSDINIPDSLETIGRDVFANTAYYNNDQNWDGNVLYIGSTLTNVKKTISGNYSIKAGTKSIAENAFEDCNNLSRVTFPDSVNYIGEYAFHNCTNINNIMIGDGVKNIGRDAFYGCTNLSNLIIPDNIINIGNWAFANTAYYNNANNWEDNVLYIGNHFIKAGPGFNYNLTLKEGTITIAEDAFWSTGLISITLPDTLVHIGNSAFGYCESLTAINIPESVTFIGNLAFRGCIKLEDVFIPGSVAQMQNAFYGCNNIKTFKVSKYNVSYSAVNGDLYNKDQTCILRYASGKSDEAFSIPASVKEIGKGAFAGSKNLKSINIPNGVSKIETNAFDGSNIESIVLPESLTSIGGVAFQNCERITSIVIPDGVSGLGDFAFQLCKNLKNVSLPNSITRIGERTFSNTAIKEIIIPKNVTRIGSSAFYNCSDLSSVTIPHNVKRIDSFAFGATDLKDVYYYGTEQEWKSIDISTYNEPLKNANFHYLDAEEVEPTVSDSKPVETTSQTPTESTSLVSEPVETTAPVTEAPTQAPTEKPTQEPTEKPTEATAQPTEAPTVKPTEVPTVKPTEIPTEAPKTDEFKWGTDNYNFNNSAPSYFKSSTYRAQINNSYLKKLQSNLTNCEYQCVFEGDGYYGGWLDEYWGGSCYGMSSTTLLSKQGLLPYADYKSGATKQSDLNAPKDNLELSSLITYYQMLQVKDVIQQQYRTVPNKSNETNIKNIISALDKNPTVLIGFQKSGWGGHAILATGYEYGSWTWDKVSYQGCIRICDPNCSIGYNKEFNIYFNTNSYNWTIPAYSGMKSTSGAKFNYVGANVNEINKGGYLSGSSGNKVDDYVARINARDISDNRSVSKLSGKNGNYSTLHASPGEIVEDYSYILGNESEGIIGYNLYDANSSYEVTQDNAQKLQLNIDYEDCLMSGGSEAGEKVIFDKNGYIEVSGESAGYNMGMTFDNSYPTDWFTITVSGENSDNASLQMVENGYVLKADNIKNVTVNANNRDNSASTTFSTDYKSVFIYEINEKIIGVKVDTDNDGEYETDIDTVEPTTVSTEPTTEKPIVTDPTEPAQIVTEPTEQPTEATTSASKVTTKKNNPIKVSVKTKTVKTKKLKKKAQTVKAITVKNAKGKVTYKLMSAAKKIRKLVKINSKGVITIKKWKKAKKGTYKIKVKITANGNADYNSKTITKTVKIKVK